ncbi:serine/threonine-protein kinase [Actinoallomurus sp. NBC_01490]|uniref:serine/threonine-protein kinase n=1 Tax=Actinoallomurus sp. NBC_01490 TaxID=2903557 RepID=UPI002E313E66|nr:serine/threonine-protein kinase [Actinoallomurus sp. NBC_01490]
MEPRQPGDPARVGPYRVLARLGEGGMGVVYLARSRSGQKVAVKVIRADFTDDSEYRARFRREVHAARKVTGAFIARVLEDESNPKNEPPWLATEYLPGLSLREAVHWFGGLPPDAVRALAAGLAEALTAIHRAGVVHRDLKPENILLTAGGPRVIDFGIARPDDAGTMTRAGVPVGTPGYMSPEQASGGRVGPAGDLFALGTVLAYAATGREPFGSGSVHSKLYRVRNIRADLGGISEPWLLDLIAGCHQKKPGRRPSAAQVVKRLDALDDGVPSLQGTRWLPAPVAEAIDRRTAEARGLPEFPVAPSRHAANDAATVQTPGAAPADGGRDAARPRRPSRRMLLGGMGALGVVALTADGVLPPPRDEGSGRRPERRPPVPARPSPPVALRWRRKVSDYYPNLIVSDGAVLAMEEASQAVLRALDPHTGRTLWKRATFLNPTAFGDVVYLLPANEGGLLALRGSSGATLWSHPLSSSVAEAPQRMAVDESVVCYGATRPTAIDARDGRWLWTAEVNSEYGLCVGAGTVAVASKKTVVGLSARSGRVRWKHDVDHGFSSMIGYGMVFVWDRFMTLHALRAGDGTLAWKRADSGYELPAQHGRLPLWRGNLYVSRPDGIVLALRAATGELVWWRRFGHGEGASYDRVNTLGLYGGTLYVGCTDRHAYAVNPADGRVLWSHGADLTLTSAPVGVAGLAFIGTKDGYVEALGPPSNTPSHSGGTRAHP